MFRSILMTGLVTAALNHSYSSHDLQVTHLDLHLKVDFEAKKLIGTADLTFKNDKNSNQLILDTNHLKIHQVYVGEKLDQPTPFKVGESDAILGEPLSIT